MEVVVTIKGSKLYVPVVADGIQWETARRGEPGKLTFTVIKDNVIAFQEGNEVTLTVDGKHLFFGYVFQKSRNKDHHIKVVAYDQLRYFKNKDLYIYENKTAGELVAMLAKDFGLKAGTLEDTGFKIAQRIEDGVTLFDIVQNALDLTVAGTNQIFVLYDDVGKLTLKNIKNMQLKTVIDDETAEDFDYTSSIDGETYNYIKLVYESDKEGKRLTAAIAKDQEHVNEWGVLQYYEKVKNETNLQARADTLLKHYNHKTRNLKIKGALGDVDVRAGCMLPVILNLGDIINKSYLLCERVIHTFEQGHHSMDLTMAGGEFVGT